MLRAALKPKKECVHAARGETCSSRHCRNNARTTRAPQQEWFEQFYSLQGKGAVLTPGTAQLCHDWRSGNIANIIIDLDVWFSSLYIRNVLSLQPATRGSLLHVSVTKPSASMRGVDTGSSQPRLVRGSSQSACCMVCGGRLCFPRSCFFTRNMFLSLVKLAS